MSRGAVVQSREKYQSGQGVKENLVSIDVNKKSRRSCSVASVSSSQVRNNLPSYQSTGIKDIMEYQHAGNYRENKVTEKCTSTSAVSRFFKFQDLHEFDFRKRPEFFR